MAVAINNVVKPLQLGIATAQTQACKRANFANTPREMAVSYRISQVQPDNSAMDNNIFGKFQLLFNLSFVSLLSVLS